MFIEVSLKLNPINYLTIKKFLDAVNWRISHVTKRQVKQPLTLSEATIPILAGNLRSLEFPLFVQYCEHLVLDLPCLLSSDTIQVCVHLSNHFHSALDNWISEAVFTNTLVEAPLWPGLSKSLQDVTWPTCSVVFDAVDINCQVGGVTKRSMSNEMGFFTINALAQSVDWAVPQTFSPSSPPHFNTPPPPYQPGPRHASTNPGNHDRARSRGRARRLPGAQHPTRDLGPRYRNDQLQEISRHLSDQSSHEYDSLTSNQQTPPRRSSPLHSSRHRTTPPPPPQRGSSPVALSEQARADLQGALGAMQTLYGPSPVLSGILQGLQDLETHPQSSQILQDLRDLTLHPHSPVAPAPIQTVELDPVTEAQPLTDWNRDASGRLQRGPRDPAGARGQTGGSAASNAGD